MVSIIKNQLLKHLSRFTKNLSADKINLSTFKGEGELSNLELDEIILTDLLELPSWLRLTSAWCNKVSFRIQWTRLKSVPIYLTLDEVSIEVETCEELRSQSLQQNLSSHASTSPKYSFINKVIDGMTIAVNTVKVTFNSPAFVASVQISKILIESKSPTWEKCDLRMSRLKDTEKGQLLIFKELVWQTVRIEAKSTQDQNLTPLRLLTNQARCRITIKKRLSDCFVLGSRLVLILDDLLWVLTDAQLQAALHFLNSLAGLVKRATELTRNKKAARKLEVLPEYRAQISQQARTNPDAQQKSAMARIFSNYDVIETSYHFLSQRIDLHLCDDPGGRSSHPELKDGAALQISLLYFQVDYYPYHLAIGDRSHWPKSRDSNSPHAQWLSQSLSAFRNRFLSLLENVSPSVNHHSPLSRANNNGLPNAQDIRKSNTTSNSPLQTNNSSSTSAKTYVLTQLAKLMTCCTIIRIRDFSLYQVSTSKQAKRPLKELVTAQQKRKGQPGGDRDRFSLPEEISILHAEFTYYYYPGDIPFPLPPPKLYAQLNPICVYFDLNSCLWLNAFALNLQQSLIHIQNNQSETTNNLPSIYIDIKMEAIMPRIVFESPHEYTNQRDRPKSLQIQVSRVSITNVRNFLERGSSLADLAKCINNYHLGSLFYGADFPANEGDINVVTEKLLNHASGKDDIREPPPHLGSCTITELVSNLSKELLWTESKDIWCISLEPIWADFYGAHSVGVQRAVPLLDAFPVTLWCHMATRDTHNEIRALAHITTLVSVQINHYQLLFLLRLAEQISELSTYLSLDTTRIVNSSASSVVFGGLIPQLEVTLVMPSENPGHDCSAGDLESVIPDSVSLQDDSIATHYTGMASIAPSTNTVPPTMTSSHHHHYQQQQRNVGPVLTCEMAVPPSLEFPSLDAGFSSMKKGFTSLMTSIDSALKTDEDTVSLASSDSENYVVVNLNNESTLDAMFRVPDEHLEIASEVVEEIGAGATDTTSPSEAPSVDSNPGYKRRDLISIATFKLSKLELVQESKGLSSTIKLQVAEVNCEQCNAIPWDEFQSKFSCRSRAWAEVPLDPGSIARVRARLDHSTRPNDGSPRSWNHDQLCVHVRELALQLNMSTITGLVDLFEDEHFPHPMPIKVFVDQVSLHLNEDRPSTNITSPGPVPINLAVDQLLIHRGMDGIFHIEPCPTSKKSIPGPSNIDIAVLEQSNRQLQQDNSELRRRLASLKKLSEESQNISNNSQEIQFLRSVLTSSQNDVDRLLEEKRQHLDRIRDLQEHLDSFLRSGGTTRR